MEKKQKKIEGITLIALVVTIVVLLILAGVSITMFTGDNGILTMAKKSREETEIGEGEEAIRLKINEAQTEKYGAVNLEYLSELFENDSNIILRDVDESEIIVEYGNHAFSIDDKTSITYLGTKDEWENNFCSITTNLSEGIHIDNKRKKIQKGQKYLATIITEENVKLSKIEVKMGKQITNIDVKSKVINIDEVTNDIIITAKQEAEIEIFEYMRKNKINPSDMGLSEIHRNSESSSLDSTRYTLYHGNGYGEYNGTMKLNINKLKEYYGLEEISYISCKNLFEWNMSQGHSAFANGSMTIIYSDGTSISKTWDAGAKKGKGSQEYVIYLDTNKTKIINTVEIYLNATDPDYASTRISCFGLIIRGSK